MARRSNELFIGKEYITLEGRTIKHPALISLYASINVNKIKEAPLDLVGLDIETNYKTSELKLLGFYDGKQYAHYTEDFLDTILSWIRYCYNSNKNLAYWNKLDPFVMYKQFLYEADPDSIELSMENFGKIGGEWDRKEGCWKIPPVVEIKRGYTYYGIQTAIRSSVKFFYYNEGDREPKTIWAYDIAQLYENGLEFEALGKLDEKTGTYPNARLKYYSKLGEEYHKINWDRFNNDPKFREMVLYSNELDARAVYDLGNIIQEEFKTAFGYYSNTLISQGSLARSALFAVLFDKYHKMYPNDPDKADKLILEDIKSIGIINYYDKWAKQIGGEQLKDMYCLFTEAYSGGQIEAYRYGYAKKGYYADIASAYPAVIMKLWDLRGAKITKGYGEPPHVPNSYVYIRGMVDIPLDVDYHPLTVKHPINKDTNIRANGNYRASYIIQERDYLVSLGAKFYDEEYYLIETEGKLSPLAEVAKHFIDLRTKLRAEGNTAQYMAKIAVNSMYGVLFEAVDTYIMENEKIVRAGYRAGEFWQPAYATQITGETRVLESKACNAIKKAGGDPVVAMTDSVIWEGTADMLPAELWREEKTVGFYEKPEEIYDIVCLGSGRYSYYDPKKGEMIAKKRGLNAKAIHDPEGIPIDEENKGIKLVNWLDALKIAKKAKSDIINVTVRSLISVGMVLHNHLFTFEDLGRVIDQDREADLIVGKSKRLYDNSLKDPKILSKRLVETKPLYLSQGMDGTSDIHDQTLPTLRDKLMAMKVVTAREKQKANRSKAQQKYAKKPKIKKKLSEDYKHKYAQVREYGYSPLEAKKMAKWGMDTLIAKFKEDGKL